MSQYQNDDPLFIGLNDKQKEAVATTEGYVRVIAGAGSGKTKTLAHRYAYLVNNIGINPSSILCVTFTNKAAQEMRSRVRKLTNMGYENDFICTYHGFCVKVLREDIHKLAYPSSFIIMDEEDQKTIMREVYEELDLKQSDLKFKQILQYISNAKHNEPYIAEYIDLCDEATQQNFAANEDIKWKCFIKYLQKQKKGFFLDFDDLINFAIYILNNNSDILDKWQRRLDYIMVDETQDNNAIQWELVDMLQRRHKNLFVVGDPDQCIYEWRGANPNTLVNLEQKYSLCKTIILDQNYRSTPNILDVANSVISNNVFRIKKDLFSKRHQLSNVVHFHGKTEQEEGDYISKVIIQHIQSGGKLSDIAILYRATYLSRFIEQSLMRHKLSYVIYGGIRFFERKEIKDTLAYLRMVNSADDLSFKRVINLPRRKIGKTFISNLSVIAEKEQKSLYETLKAHLSDKEFDNQGAHEFVKLIESIRREVNDLTISDIVQNLLEQSKLYDSYRQDGDEDRIDNIKELIVSIQSYEKDNINEEDLSLTKYLQDIALYTNLDYKEDTDNIKIMTIHQAKGLEFPVVFVAGMYEGVFPSYRTIKERKQKGIEEERRLAYVAYTRAENELYLTESEGYSFETQNEKYPSRFIFEITQKLLVKEGQLSKELEKKAQDYIKLLNAQIKENENESKLQCGMIVKHKIFGLGQITELTEGTENAVIKFVDYEEPKHFTKSKINDTNFELYKVIVKQESGILTSETITQAMNKARQRLINAGLNPVDFGL